MSLVKVTLSKAWTNSVGLKCKVGETMRVTPELHAELLEGGYIQGAKATKKTTQKK